MSEIVKLIEAREATAIEVGQRRGLAGGLAASYQRSHTWSRGKRMNALNISSFIWGIADAVLEPTKEDVQ